MTNIVISGATGYLGRKVCAFLRSRGIEPLILARPQTDLSRIDDLSTRPPVHWPEEPLPSADVLLILGTVFSGHTLAGQAQLMAQANVLLPIQLAEAYLQAGGKRIVATGTCWEFIYGTVGTVNTYAASKSAARGMLGTMVAERGASLCWLALSDTFGIDDPRPKIFNGVRDAIHSGHRLGMTAGTQTFDPLAASDAARAIALSCLEAEPRGIWGIAGGEPAALRDKIESYCTLLGQASPCDWDTKPYRFGEPFQLNWKAPPPWWRPEAPFSTAVMDMERQPGGLLHSRRTALD